ncbi:MAG: hypothetical protein MK212_09425 [Saprospiraceae bacterium]|nr:hypothetical protein [Saprospiraceae bacterium]
MKLLHTLIIGILICFSIESQAQRKIKSVEDWDSFLVPSVGYTGYLPQGSDSIGFFHGVNTEFLFYVMNMPAYKGPSYFKVYGRFNLAQSTNLEKGQMFSYAMGVGLSFEKAIYRKFMIPYFGLELGGMYQRDVGGAFTVYPLLGINFISTRHVTWYLQGGYNYATNHFDVLSGVAATMGITVQFW